MERRKTVKVSVEVRSGTPRFRVGVLAGSIEKALSLVGGRYPHGEVRVAFPAEPAGIFVRGLSDPVRMVGAVRPAPWPPESLEGGGAKRNCTQTTEEK